MRVIDLDPADTYYSVRHRLLQNGRERTVLVLPAGDYSVSPIDLVLWRRLADRERLDIGLVTTDRSISREARAAGLPAFSNVTLAEYYRPGWWRAGRRKARLGFGPGDDRRPAQQKASGTMTLTAPTTRRRPLLALLAAALVVGLAIMAGLYTLPQVAVGLPIAPRPAQVILDLTADTAISTLAGDSLPGHPIRHMLEWEAGGLSTNDPAADQERIRAQALQGLGTAAPEMLAARLDPGMLLVPASVRVAVDDETFAPRTDTSRLRLRATISGMAVAEADLNRVAYRALAATLPAGYEPDAADLRVNIEPAAGDESDHFQITARTTARPVIDAGELAQAIRGQRTTEATATLSSAASLSAPPVFDAKPGWWLDLIGRLPFNAERIRVEIRP